jgi:O-antigen/teichoic acid export membrane protein
MDLKSVFKSSFFKNVLYVLTGTMASQLIGILILPLLTRMYTPEQFGYLAYFLSLSSVLIPFVGLAFFQAIVVAKDKHEFNIVKLSISSILVLSLFTVTIYYLLVNIVSVLSEKDYSYYFYIFIFSYVVFNAIGLLLKQILYKGGEFKSATKSSVIASFTSNAVKLVLGVVSASGYGLIIAVTVGELINFLYLSRLSKKSINQFKQNSKQQNKSIKESFILYKDFPLYMAPQLTINALSISMPGLLLVSLFSFSSAGFYALAKSVLGLPTNLIANSIGSVLYPKLASIKEKSPERLFKVIKQGTLGLTLVGIPIYGLFFLFGQELFSFIFGEQWSFAGEYASWLSLGWFTNFSAKACVSVIPVIEKQRLYLFYTIINVVLRMAGLFTCSLLMLTDIQAIQTYSVVGVVMNSVMIFTVLFYLKSKYN